MKAKTSSLGLKLFCFVSLLPQLHNAIAMTEETPTQQFSLPGIADKDKSIDMANAIALLLKNNIITIDEVSGEAQLDQSILKILKNNNVLFTTESSGSSDCGGNQGGGKRAN